VLKYPDYAHDDLSQIGPPLIYSPDAATIQKVSIAKPDAGACHRSGLGRQTPAKPNTSPLADSKAPHRNMRSSIGS